MVFSALPCRPRVRTDVGFARGDANVIVDNAGDRVRRNAGAVVLDADARRHSRLAGRDGDLDDRRDLGILAGVNAVIDQLLGDDAQPLIGLVTGLRDQLLLGTEFHQARRGERYPLDLVHRLIRFLLGTAGDDAAGLKAEPRPGDGNGAGLTTKGVGNRGQLVAARPHRLQQLPALRRPADARLNIRLKPWASSVRSLTGAPQLAGADVPLGRNSAWARLRPAGIAV